MLYQYKLTGGLVEKISQHDEGVFMCVDANEEVLYIEENMLVPHLDATTEKIKNEEKFTQELKADGVKPAKPTAKETSTTTETTEVKKDAQPYTEKENS